MSAWTLAVPSLEVIARDTANPTLYASSVRVCCDLCGDNAHKIIREWWRWRRHRPIAFMQDSQARFHADQFRFRWSMRDVRAPISLLNFIRGLVRELLARMLFAKVGYISHKDAAYVLPKGTAVDVLLPQLTACMTLKEPAPAASPLIGVLGNFLYSPNSDGLKALLNHRRFGHTLQRNGLKLALLGIGSMELLRSLPIAPRSLISEADSGPFADLHDVAQPFPFFISPAMYGAGIKNKLLELAALKKPCFAWHGFRGEHGYDDDYTYYFDSIDQLATHIELLSRLRKETSLTNPALLKAAHSIRVLFDDGLSSEFHRK